MFCHFWHPFLNGHQNKTIKPFQLSVYRNTLNPCFIAQSIL
jgi:hypothetical protein